MTPAATLRAAAEKLRARTWDPTAAPLADAVDEHVREQHKEHDRGYNCVPEDGCGMVRTARAVLADARPTALPDDLLDRYEAIATTAPPLYARHLRDLLRLLLETDSMRAVLAGQAAERGQLAGRVRELEREVDALRRMKDVMAEGHAAALARRASERDALRVERGHLRLAWANARLRAATYREDRDDINADADLWHKRALEARTACEESHQQFVGAEAEAARLEIERDALLAALDPGLIADALTAHLYPDDAPGEGESGQHREEAEAIVKAIRQAAGQAPTAVLVQPADLANALAYIIGADPISVVDKATLDRLFAALKPFSEADRG